MRVAIVGPGRLGSSLAALLGAATPIGREGVIPPADVVVLAVPAAALPEVVTRLPAAVPALHTAGALDADALSPHSPRGVFHPLMTFPGVTVAIPDLTGVGVRVAGDAAALLAAHRLADQLGMRPFQISGDPQLYHAAAVMAGNFSTVLLAHAAAVLAAAGVDPREAPALLGPLALASVRHAAVDPRAALTGPAARGDRGAIEAHRIALRRAGLTVQVALYDRLTELALELGSRAPSTDRDTT